MILLLLRWHHQIRNFIMTDLSVANRSIICWSQRLWQIIDQEHWFDSGEQISYMSKLKAEVNNWSARNWQITIFCDKQVQSLLFYHLITVLLINNFSLGNWWAIFTHEHGLNCRLYGGLTVNEKELKMHQMIIWIP